MNAKTILRSALLALFLFLPTLAAAEEPIRFEAGRLRIDLPSGVSHLLDVELALSPAQRERGLMNRTELGPDDGMLFDFGQSREVMMWMKNTPLSLDMLFIDDTGLVTKIAANTKPFSENILSSGGPVKYVLEINGGRAEALKIEPGATVHLQP
ncbi:MAG: DUF192 domain-containing protein [Allorhizobium sp.]